MTAFKIKDVNQTVNWCSKFISPRGYVLHNRIGGKGWRIDTAGKSILTIEDEKKALLAILKFGDQT